MFSTLLIHNFRLYLFNNRLLRNYVYGNRRVETAVDRVCGYIRPSHSSLLDVGCGIGISSGAIAERAPWVTVTGVDISPKNVAAADALFSSERVRFEVSAMDAPPQGGPFDVISLIDVYEHIPRADWPQFNAILGKCLSGTGLIILTTPSPLHQEFLASNSPNELQIVDETVQSEDVLALERDLNGVLVLYEYMSIGRTNDYVHVVIDRHPVYAPIDRRRRSLLERITQKIRQKRRIRVRRRRLRSAIGVEL